MEKLVKFTYDMLNCPVCSGQSTHKTVQMDTRSGRLGIQPTRIENGLGPVCVPYGRYLEGTSSLYVIQHLNTIQLP